MSKKSCLMNDELARQVESIWKQAFPDAALFPVVGLPSNADGVMTLTHRHHGPLLKINGLPSKSPLSNNALYSAECSKGHYLNLYEVMLPDLPGKRGQPSVGEYYVKLLHKYGLSVAGVHFHWWGNYVFDTKDGNRVDRGVAAIHHQSTKLDPVEFSRRTIKALQKVFKLIDERIEKCRH